LHTEKGILQKSN